MPAQRFLPSHLDAGPPGRPAAVAKRGELRSAQWASQWGGGMEEQIYLLFDIGGTSVKYAAGDGRGPAVGPGQLQNA